MAIGVVVANAFKDIVNKFTSSFINPLVAYLTGDKSLVDLKYVIVSEALDAETGAVIQKEIAFTWGIFLQSIVGFLIIAFVLFLVLRIASHISKKSKELRISDEERAAAKAAADAEIAAAKAREIETVELLREIRNSLSKK